MIKLTGHMALQERITSRDNRRLVALRKVRDGLDRARIFIEGTRLVEEALRSHVDLEECFVSDQFGASGKLPQLAARATPVADRLFASISHTKTPQGVIAVARRPVTALDRVAAEVKPASPTVLFLSEISNPQNLGAIIRTAEAAGVAGVLISANSADPFSPGGLRASMGSAFRVPIVTGAGRGEIAGLAAERGMVTTAADVKASKVYTEVDWTIPRLLIFGSEAHGLSGTDLSSMDETIRVPMNSRVESLNLAVSAGIILFEARRQIGR